METKVSIIVPSYRPGDYLCDCLQAIKAQTVNDYEVLIILNGEREPYEKFIKGLVTELGMEECTRLLYSEQKGVSNARNMGLDVAQGEFICFVDDDDLISPNYLETLLTVSSPDCVGCSNSMSFRDGQEGYKDNFLTAHFRNCTGQKYSQYRFRGFLSPPGAKLIHRSIIEKARFNPHLFLSEDSLFCMTILPRIKRMSLVSCESYYFMRERQGSATRQMMPLSKNLHQLLIVEYNYIKQYLTHPFAYNVIFMSSRCVGAVRNFMRYIESNKRQ